MAKKIPVGVWLVAGVAVAYGAYYYVAHRGYEETDDAMIEARIVPISAAVEGYAAEVPVRDNQPLKAQDVLVQIDAEHYQIARDRSLAELKSAEAEAKRAVAELRRMQDMTNKARTERQLDEAVANEAAAEAAVDLAKAKLAAAEKDLRDTVLRAPENGMVTKKAVVRGAYVTAGQVLMQVVSEERWVIANFKETQTTSMRAGQKVAIHVDACPKTTLQGHVDSIQAGTGARFSLFPPENATGNFVKVVQRIPVKIVFDNPAETSCLLAPGMSVLAVTDVR